MASSPDTSFPLDAMSLTKAAEEERNLLRQRQLAAWKARQPAPAPTPAEPVIVVTDPTALRPTQPSA